MGIYNGPSIYNQGGGGGGYKEGGSLVDGDFIKVENNTVSSYDNVSRDPINLSFEVKDGEILNSVVELTTAVNATVNVYVLRNGFYYLLGNVGGDAVTAGNDYKVNITGDSYSIEQVSAPPEVAFIDSKLGPIPVKKIGSVYWARKNLDVVWSGLPIGSSYATFDGFYAMWYNDDESTMKARNAGLLYSPRAADYIQANISSLVGDGWRVPEISDFTNLRNAYSSAPDVKAANLSYAPNWGGNDSSKMSFVPTGMHNGSAFYYYPGRSNLWLKGWSGSSKDAFEIRDDNTYTTNSGTKAFAYGMRLVMDE